MTTEIHPELVKAGKLFKFIFRPNRTLLGIFYKLTNRNRKAKIEGFKNDTYFIPRSRAEGEVRIRVYGPCEPQQELPVLLYLHGGGLCINSPETAHTEIGYFLNACPCIVVAPDYTKTVHAPYPAAINDCEDTLDWLLENIQMLGIRSDKLVIGGHSAGGGLTVALLLRIRERGDISVAYQMPIYPMMDHRSSTESARDNDMPVWNTKLNKLAWKMYLGDLHESQAIPFDAAPAQAKDYSGLPPAMTFVGNLDPFLDETINYVESLKRDNVPVEMEVFDKCYHAFELVVPNATPSRAAIAFMQKKFTEAVNTLSAPQPDQR